MSTLLKVLTDILPISKEHVHSDLFRYHRKGLTDQILELLMREMGLLNAHKLPEVPLEECPQGFDRVEVG